MIRLLGIPGALPIFSVCQTVAALGYTARQWLAKVMWVCTLPASVQQCRTCPPVAFKCPASFAALLLYRSVWPSENLTSVCTCVLSSGTGRNAYGSLAFHESSSASVAPPAAALPAAGAVACSTRANEVRIGVL